jgi:membrane protease YdiL (CAAX protease family)
MSDAEFVLGLVGCIVVAWLLLCSWLWVLAIIKVSRNQSVLTLVPRGRVPWDYTEILACFLMPVLGGLLARYCLVYFGLIPGSAQGMNDLSVDQRGTMLLVNGLVHLAAMLLVMLWIYKRAGWQARDRQSTCERTGENPLTASLGLSRKLSLGFLSAIMLIPPTLIVQGIATRIIPYRHDLLDLLRQGLTPYFIFSVFFSAVVVAPLWEEFFFRKLLQGWLESTDPRMRLQTRWRMPSAESPTLSALEVPQDFSQPLVEASTTESIREMVPPTWPLFVSASIFALAHNGQGPAPIPLFFLALGLGFLYRQTHSVIPCMVVHASLNCLSLTTAVLSIK